MERAGTFQGLRDVVGAGLQPAKVCPTFALTHAI